MLLAEKESLAGPTLVHGDAYVVDSKSCDRTEAVYWVTEAGLRDSRHLYLANCVQGAATMINSPLRDKASSRAAVFPYDYHNGVIAAATGQRRFIDKPLLLYRQHSSNAIGAGKTDHTKPRSFTKISPALQMAINGFPIIQQSLGFFADELSAATVEELNDASQLLFGDNVLKRLLHRVAQALWLLWATR